MTDARHALNSGDPRQITAVQQAVKSGDMGSLITATFTGLTSLATHDITAAEAFANVVLRGIAFDADEIALPPIGTVVSCRATQGAGPLARVATDELTTPTTLNVVVSEDRTSVTFEAATTAFILQYYAAPAGGMDQNLPGLGAP